MMTRVLALGAVVVVACNGTAEPPEETAPTPTSTTVATATTTTTTQPLVEGCAGEGDFVEGGRIGQVENPGSDTGAIGLIGWEAEESCETFEISFETSEGAPATTPPTISARYVDELGVVRVQLDATSTVVTDQLVETSLVERLFVVRDLRGGMFIDFHLSAPAQARFVTHSSPARMILQLQPGIVEYERTPTSSSLVVLVSPQEDATISTTATVAGYSRTFESNVLVIATRGDEVVAETQTTAADSVETWGEFSAELELTPGPVSLFVGEENAETGRLEGVSIDLTAR